MGLILISWVGPKVNGFGPIKLGWAQGKWVGLKVNGLDLRSGLGLNKLGWT